MAAYFIVNLDVKDRERFEAYRQQVVPVVEKHGGRYLVRGGELHPVEGDLGLKRLVVLNSRPWRRRGASTAARSTRRSCGSGRRAPRRTSCWSRAGRRRADRKGAGAPVGLGPIVAA